MPENDDEMYEEAGPDTSESGAPIYRHSARERPYEPAYGDEGSIEEITAHIEKHIGPIDTVFHEILSDLVHIDVHFVKANAERPFHALVTSGMSDMPMKAPIPECQWAELCILLPPSWKLGQEDFKDETNYWPIRWLKTLARMPHEYDTWLWAEHTVPNGDPPSAFVPNTELCGWLVYPSATLPQDFRKLRISDDKSISFWTLLALHEDEMDLKLKKGVDDLIDLFQAKQVSDILDPNRPSACEPRKRGWFFRR